jgi:hypothetical protein
MKLETLIPYLPFLIPILLIEVSLAIIALIHVLKHPTYRFWNRTIWIFVVLIFQLIGPILYFIWGRGDN